MPSALTHPLTFGLPADGAMLGLAGYEQGGGYQGLAQAQALDPAAITAAVVQSNLRGRGGAGFPTGRKWAAVPMGAAAPRPKYIVVNADEMEPGTFKDRLLLECNPHLLLEGIAICARAVEAEAAYIFLRGEYTLAAQRLRRALAETQAARHLEGLRLDLHTSAGRYMCGEETGMLNALEGKRANPRTKPPYPGVSGLWGKPTVVNNVETLCNLPGLLRHGAGWFLQLSHSDGDGGTKLYGVSGKVRHPGLWEMPMGTTVREILEQAGGMRDGVQLRGLLPGGASTAFLLPQHLDVRMDFTAVQKVGSRMGTGTMIVLDDQACPVGLLRNLMHFFAQESCGWCTPCWSGLGWAEQLLAAMEAGQGQPGDVEKLGQLAEFWGPGATFCALAPGAADPLQSGIRCFRADFERHLAEHRCPWGETMPNVQVDGRAFAVAGGQSWLQACLALGFDLPYFCWHPALGSVGACRQCAVQHFKDEHDTQGRLVMACMTPVEEGTRVSLAAPAVVAFRRSVIEGMMLHHPHDCPVCDEGGHCHLQDMTVMTGHNYRRYRFVKRTFRNQYLGPLLHHEMNRCIQCYRCVRFYREYAGGNDLDAFGIRDRVFFGRAEDGVLQSEFAGNLAEVCPTGVFTDATLKRHYTRKWDLRWAPSVCPHCALGCNTSPGERYGSVRAVVNRYHGEVNGYFLCDRGRFGYEYLASPQRVRTARWRGAPVTPADGATQLRRLLSGSLIGIGSPRASLESNFALRQLVGPERFFAGMAPGELELARRMIEILRAGPARNPSLREIEGCDAVLVLGEDLTQTAARLALSLRQASRQQPLREISDPLQIPRWLDHAAREAIQGQPGPLFIATPAATKLDALATQCFRLAPGDIARLASAVADALAAGGDAAASTANTVARALRTAERPLVITGSSCNSVALVEAAARIAATLCRHGKAAALSLVLPECNSLGLALLAPRPLADGLAMAQGVESVIDTAVVVENDLAHRAPRATVERFLEYFQGDGRHLIVLDQIRHATADAGELLLPATSCTEGDGTLVSSEGRAQRFFQAAVPDAAIRESWRWLEQAQGRDPTLDDMVAQIGAAFPELEPVRRAAPPATFRIAQQKIARETHRSSGRTAIHAALAVSEPQPPADPDTALSFTMEGYAAQPPAALTPYLWAPGWNSPQSALTYQSEINAPLRGGDAGWRLLEASASSPSETRGAQEGPPPFARRPGHWLVVRLFHLFGSEELSRHGEAIASLSPGVYVAMNAADAATAGLQMGTMVHLRLGGYDYEVPLRLEASLPAGVVGVPAGLAAFDGAGLPAWGAITAAPEGGEG